MFVDDQEPNTVGRNEGERKIAKEMQHRERRDSKYSDATGDAEADGSQARFDASGMRGITVGDWIGYDGDGAEYADDECADSDWTDTDYPDSDYIDDDHTDGDQTDTDCTDSDCTDSDHTDSDQTDTDYTDNDHTDGDQTADDHADSYQTDNNHTNTRHEPPKRRAPNSDPAGPIVPLGVYADFNDPETSWPARFARRPRNAGRKLRWTRHGFSKKRSYRFSVPESTY